MGRYNQKKNHPTVHAIVGLVPGPRNSVVVVGFFGFLVVVPPIFFNRASAAAARSARIRSRSSSVKFSSTTSAGCGIVLSLLLDDADVVAVLVFCVVSLIVPNRRPYLIY